MTSINQKLGIKPAGKRSMMKLPNDPRVRTAVTSAVCPQCSRRGANLSRTVEGELFCTWCSHTWALDLPAERA